MLPAARVQAVIELLVMLNDASAENRQIPADALIGRYFKDRRYIGSKDKGAIAELFYYVLRYEICLSWLISQQSRKATERLMVAVALVLREGMDAAGLTAIYSGERFAPPALLKEEQQAIRSLVAADCNALLAHAPASVRLNVPEWMYQKFTAHYQQDAENVLGSLMQEAPTDIRVNMLKTDRDTVITALEAEGITAEPTPYAAHGVRIHKRAALFALPIFKQGWFEMQDEGSQLIAEIVQARVGECVIDMCAGAGGKTLAIAAAMRNKGKVLAWDVSEKRLADLPKRLKRAGVDNVEWHQIASAHDSWIKRHKGRADWVLVDAPCTGTGTWRRNPDLKRRSGEEGLAELCRLQAEILDSAARLVKTGGRLVYATCSLLAEENQQQMEAFLQRNPSFSRLDVRLPTVSDTPLPYLTLNPYHHGTDGFFATVMQRHA